jgi:ATP-dependent DNA ligase
MSMMEQPYEERRAILEARRRAAVRRRRRVGWEVVAEQHHEGVVAKRLRDPYVPGDRRLWVKTKSLALPRSELEREAIAKPLRGRRLSAPSTA